MTDRQAGDLHWTEPVSYVTEGYEPGEMEAILRNIDADREREAKRNGPIGEAFWRKLKGGE